MEEGYLSNEGQKYDYGDRLTIDPLPSPQVQDLIRFVQNVEVRQRLQGVESAEDRVPRVATLGPQLQPLQLQGEAPLRCNQEQAALLDASSSGTLSLSSF